MSKDVDLYWDVDGVFNAVSWKPVPDWDWPEDTMRQEPINGFRITWSTELVDRINALNEKPHVHSHWLTTWLDLAPQMIAPGLGIKGAEEWPVLGAEDHGMPASGYGGKFSEYHWWKFPAAQRQFDARGHKAVWIDDDLFDRKAREWAFGLNQYALEADDPAQYGRVQQYGDDLLLVMPATEVGVTRDMMTKIEEFVG